MGFGDPSHVDASQLDTADDVCGFQQSPEQWRFEFFHGWLRDHVMVGTGRCLERRCHAERARHPCQLRRHAVAELVRDGHIPEDAASEVEAGKPCCDLAVPVELPIT